MAIGITRPAPHGTSVNGNETVAARKDGRRARSISLWTAQGLLAAMFLFAGTMKLLAPYEDLAAQSTLSVEFLRFIGLCETLGAIGQILPGLLRIRPGLTPLAACGLMIIMAGATVISLAGGAGIASLIPFGLGVLAAFVAYGRRTALQTLFR